jgi:predicted ATP-dependent endonuclease of OLD family
MITSLQFDNFRTFPELTISPLKQINLIAGANNTGKTCILEGLTLMFNGNQSNLPAYSLPGVFRSSLAGPNQFNADDFTTFWENLFYDRQLSVEPKILAHNDGGELLTCRFKNQNNAIQVNHERVPLVAKAVQIDPSFKHVMQPQQPQLTWLINNGGQFAGQQKPNPCAQELIILSTCLTQPAQDAELYNQISLLEGGEERLLHLLQQLDPRLQKLRYARPPRMSQALVYAYFGMRNAISISQTGQGFSKLFSLFCRMILSKATILIIDEIENGLYYETLPEIWKGIATLAASEKIQVFATTHSRECILAAHETLKKLPSYDFALHRLQRVKGKIEAVTHDQEMLEAAIKSGLEVR